MHKIRMFIARQMQQCICLVFILIIDLFPLAAADISVEEYFLKQINRRYPDAAMFRGCDDDSASGTKIQFNAGTDQIYHEIVRQNDSVKSAGDWVRNDIGFVMTGTNGNRGGSAGLSYRDAGVSWSGDQNAMSGSARYSGADVFFSGWFERGSFTGAAGLTSEIPPLNAVRQNAYPVRNFRSLLASQLMDGFIAVQDREKWGSITLTASNNTPLAVSAEVFNSLKTAERRFICQQNENTLSLLFSGKWREYVYDVTTRYGLLEEGHPVTDQPAFPVYFDGWRNGSRAEVKKQHGRWRSEFMMGYDYFSLGVHGFDAAGETFIRSGSLEHTALRSRLFVNERSGSGTGLFVNVQSGNCPGLVIDYYPFTSWMLLFDLPDGMKINVDSYTCAEAGFTGRKVVVIGKKQEVTLQGALSKMTSSCKLRTEERERYLGLLPVYRDEKLFDIKKEHLIVKIAAEYGIKSNNKNYFLQLQQILPISLGGTQNNGILSSTDKVSGKRQVFGGFSVQCGVALYTGR